MAVSECNKRVILTRSGNNCAFSGCDQILVKEKTGKDPHVLVAEIAHISGEKEGSSRYDLTISDNERNDPDNLIVLCPNHHTIIDKQPEEYTVEKLLRMKRQHEDWVITQMSNKVLSVSFSELDVVTEFLISNTSSESEIKIIPPKDKIEKNQISTKVENLIKMGLAQVNLVKEYINQSIDPEFGERLKQGFVKEYIKLVEEENLKGDKLFDCLLDFASSGSTDFKRKAAGLIVLSYFFETCDIFEK